MKQQENAQRLPAERRYLEQLVRIAEEDSHPVPPGWRMSPLAVERFIVGDPQQGIERKFVAEPGVVQRIVISLCSNRGCFMVGEPGTAKSWLSELLAAAICGDSTIVAQGTGISDTRQLLYGWDQAKLTTAGMTSDALVPGPVYRAMRDGKLLRFEELSRCPPHLQDSLLSVLSERVMMLPELGDQDGLLYAAPGFNVVATSNSVDEGVHGMSVALRRRLNFETIRPIRRLQDELDVVLSGLRQLNRQVGVEMDINQPLIEVLVTLFHELRCGQTMDGRSTHRLEGAALSTAEAIEVAFALSVYAFYYRDGEMRAADLLHFIIGTALKDRDDDRRRLKYYFDAEVGEKSGEHWRALYEQRHLL